MKKFTPFWILVSAGLVFGQQSSSPPPEEDVPPAKAPVLIRDEIDKPPAPVERNPARAEEEVKVGDFYFKRDNFRAAIARYQEALQYRPDYPVAYEKLIRALERNKDSAKARQWMHEYLGKFPNGNKAAEYARLLAR
ncbi:MAG: tetratricopeptide repeat protein [Acidobacteria bacterium]|nr:tetratricopeptide repeat protein [Acidobacteriota bacterium]